MPVRPRCADGMMRSCRRISPTAPFGDPGVSHARRRLSVSSIGTPASLKVFDTRVKWLQRERAARSVEQSRQVDYLRDEVASRLCERLLDMKRTFPRALDYGANSCNIARILTQPNPDSLSDRPPSDLPPLATRISALVAADTSASLLHRDADLPFNNKIAVTRQVLEDGERMSFAPASFDLVLSSLSLHWINNLPGVLTQINRVLRPDCPFLGAMLGGDTLFELRTSLQLAEQERRGGVSSHVSPLADVRDVGGLMQRAGFHMLTVDVDDVVVNYPDPFVLMQDLQAMGESNAVLGREQSGIRRDVLMAAGAIYREMHGNEDGTVPATFRVIYMMGWTQGENQARPLVRGSGQVDLKKMLEIKA